MAIFYMIKNYFVISVILLILSSCGDKSSSRTSLSAYEQAYNDNFDALIAKTEGKHDICDTLYTEMYIALKTIEDDDACGDIVIDRVNKLMMLDIDPENQRHYLEAATIVYSIRKDYDNFWRVSLQSYNTYPHNSFERLSSLAAYYTIVKENPDSSSFYINSAKKVAYKMNKSNDSEKRLGSCIGLTTLCILEGKDMEAKNIINQFISSENNPENIEVAKSMIDDFQSFKNQVLTIKRLN